MFKPYSHSKDILIAALLLLAATFTLAGCGEGTTEKFGGRYTIAPEDPYDETDKKWAQYLYTHLQRRGGGENAPVHYESSQQKSSRIEIHIDCELDCDYTIKNRGSNICITARNEKTILWLIYQFMRKAGDTSGAFAVSDLPPSIISFSDTTATFPFEYRDIYLPANLDPDMSGILCTHSIDYDWGLWGHNLHTTLPEDASEEIYALSNGKRSKEQYCFSSDRLFDYITSYILNNFGDGERFAILPNDNDIVCQCPKCVEAGNSKTNATPAATNMLRRLAKQFPTHKFFTLAYRTTQAAPQNRLPENCGVFVSAIKFPLGADFNGKTATEFRNTLKDWQQKSNSIYVWDYISNFDDYLTPFPMLRTMQKRLQTYRELGVEGIFLNGSGESYSTFQHIHTSILSALMLNPDAPLDRLIDDHFERRYTASAQICKEYYNELMDAFDKPGNTVGWYNGIEETQKRYLSPMRFAEFYQQLAANVDDAHEGEEYRVRRILTALTYTRLEVARSAGFADSIGYARLEGNTIVPDEKVSTYLHRLADNHSLLGFDEYTEAGDNIDDYIMSWKRHVLVPEHFRSLLFGEKLTVSIGGKNERTGKLTDGQPGLPGSYHSGWMIMPPATAQITIPCEKIVQSRGIRISFLQMPRHRISIPRRIEVWQNSKMLSSTEPIPTGNTADIVECHIKTNAGNSGDVVLKMYPAANGHNIATDEIYLIPKK